MQQSQTLKPGFVEAIGTDDFPEVQQRLDVIHDYTLANHGVLASEQYEDWADKNSDAHYMTWAAVDASEELICVEETLDDTLADEFHRSITYSVVDSDNGQTWSLFPGYYYALSDTYADLSDQEVADKVTTMYEEVAATNCLLTGDEDPVLNQEVFVQKLAEYEAQG